MADLKSASVTAPGFRGLNTQQEFTVLSPEWATEANNAVIDESGRIASRKGWTAQNAAISGEPDVEQVFEYIDSSGNIEIISAAGNKIYSGLSGTLTNVTPPTAPTANNWKFQNFNGKVVGWQANHTPIVYQIGDTQFSDITADSGTIPTGNDVIAASGRLWALDSTGTVVRYSDLLQYDVWNDADSPGSSGQIDLKAVWVYGMDQAVALAVFNNNLIIFGKRGILVYGGIDDPNNSLSLVENIQGIGCIARDSVQNIGNDILFLSRSGVRSLSRTVLQDKMPIGDISANVKDFLDIYVSDSGVDSIRSVYSQREGFYVITFPEYDRSFVFDMRREMQDGTRRATTWSSSTPLSLHERENGDILMGQSGGYIGLYDGYSDNGDKYKLTYRSGWMDFQSPEYTKIAKRLRTLLRTGANNTISFKWYFNFTDTFKESQRSVASDEVSEYNVAEYNIDEWSGGSSLFQLNVPLSRSGQYVKFGFDVDINGSSVSIQGFSLQTKIGKLA